MQRIRRIGEYVESVLCKETHPDSRYSLYMKILQLCIDQRAAKAGLWVHNHIITNGFDSNVHLDTKLVIFYAKLGCMVTAHNLFDRMCEKSIVSWTAMISGYTQNGCYGNALMVFEEMNRCGIKANQFGYGSILRACTGLRCLDRGKQVQAGIQKSRFVGNLYVQSALVDFYSKCGRMEDASSLFGNMSRRDLVSWNTMIGSYAVQGFTDEAFQIFRSMMQEGEKPDCFTFGSLLSSLARGSYFMNVSQVHGLIIQLGYGSYNTMSGSLIDAYAKCGSIESSYQLFKSLIKKDLVSCTAMITGYAREVKHIRDAFYLFKEMKYKHMGIDGVVLCSMLNLCANIISLSLGRQIHALTIKYQFCYDVALGNALIDMYAKSGEIEEAHRAFDDMEEKNIISWTSLINGYGKHGNGEKAIALYKRMECEGLKPNDVTFLSLLFACSHTGLTTEGWECFNDMVNKYDIFPRAKHLSCLVDLFARGGQLEEAYNLMCKMKVKPNASLWGSILGACSIYGNMSLGEVAAMQLFKMDPSNSVNYVVLASIYAAAGAWERALKIRNLIEEKSLKKEAGCSLLQSTKDKTMLLQAS